MKKFSLIVFIAFFIQYSFCQIASRDEVISFWNSNIEALKVLDKEKIINQTNFPLEGSWGYVIGLESEPNSWTKEDFSNSIETLFNPETIKELKTKSFNDLVHIKNEKGELEFILNLNFYYTPEGSDETFESSTIYFFRKTNNLWKLYSIEYAG